jgi:hypothetical protein
MDPLGSSTSFSSVNEYLPKEPSSEKETTEEASTQPPPPYQYSKEAPINEISLKEVADVARAFSDSIGEYATANDDEEVTDPHPLDDQPSDADRWNERSLNAIAVAERINKNADTGPENDKVTFSYDLGGDSAALMTLRHGPGATLISELATHPGTLGAGKIMVEKAVNESQTAGNDGKVHLASLNKASTEFYGSLGFKQLKPLKSKNMELNPSDSHLWSQGNDGKWSLKEYERSQFFLKKKHSEPSQTRGLKRPHEDEETPNVKRPHLE